MSGSLKKWMNMTILHEYFEQEKCPVFSLLPLAETQRLLKNYGIRFQQSVNEYTFYVPLKPTQHLWEVLTLDEDLYFLMNLSDTKFECYTKIPDNKKEGELLYITNAEVSNRMHEEESIDANTYLPVRPLGFNVSCDAEKITKVEIKDSRRNLLFTSESISGQKVIPVDLRVFGSGIYALWIDGVQKELFFGTNEQQKQSTYGVVHIQMHQVLESLKENTEPQLAVHFETKSTFWQYAVVIHEDKKINVLELNIEEEGAASYEDDGTKILAGGTEALVFTSQNEKKLVQKPKEHPLLTMRYTNEYSDTLMELDLKMPAPKPFPLVVEEQENEKVYYSQTIIYV